MATNADFMEYVREQIGAAGEIAFRRMFGEYAVYLGGKVVALLCDNQFYLKPTAAGRELLGTVTEAPPFPGASLYFRLDAALEDPELMVGALRTTAAALPVPRPKGVRAAKPKAKANRKPKAKAKPKAELKAEPRATRKPKPKPKPTPVTATSRRSGRTRR